MDFLANPPPIMVKYYMKSTFCPEEIEIACMDSSKTSSQDTYLVDLPARPNLDNFSFLSESIGFVGHESEPKHL